MIDRNENPVAWALLGYQLSDAAEHLNALLRRMADEADFDEVEFRTGLGHVYAHLNRAWNMRDVTDAETGSSSADDLAAWSRFPTDLDPV